jgi:hypothetical protein
MSLCRNLAASNSTFCEDCEDAISFQLQKLIKIKKRLTIIINEKITLKISQKNVLIEFSNLEKDSKEFSFMSDD